MPCNEDSYVITSDLITKWMELGLGNESLNAELTQIIDKHTGKNFPVILDDQRQAFVTFIFSNDFTTKMFEFERSLIIRLNFLRICLRDKSLGESNVLSSILPILLKITFLDGNNVKLQNSAKILLEANKCLVNFLFNSSVGRAHFKEEPFKLLISRISFVGPILKGKKELLFSNEDGGTFVYLNNWCQQELEELLLLDMKIVFVVSAQERQLQLACQKDVNINKIFQEIIANSLDKLIESPSPSNIVSSIRPFINEALLILFNIYHQIVFQQQPLDSNIIQLFLNECARILQNSFLDMEIKQNTINFMATIPNTLSTLCPKTEDSTIYNQNKLIFEDYDVTFSDKLLNILEEHIDQYEKGNVPAFSEHLVMFLRMMTTLCMDHKVARRYCRLKVIPPLTAEDVKHRPDVGSSFRNKLVRLISSIGALSNASADFLFVLCKRSAGRLVKYTGFGHAAGLLADRGILGRALAPKHPSDSEDSETEGYKEVENEVNPVTGYIPPVSQMEEFRKQFESMSEEQKEHEAMKLVNAMDKLMDQGLIAPGTVGEDGRVRQVKHVSELIKDVEKADEKEDSD
uniref:Synembryn n=1 Tax=Meloidogyne incognita TaxID=6306 RepID=A0A914MTA3_MELIC